MGPARENLCTVPSFLIETTCPTRSSSGGCIASDELDEILVLRRPRDAVHAGLRAFGNAGERANGTIRQDQHFDRCVRARHSRRPAFLHPRRHASIRVSATAPLASVRARTLEPLCGRELSRSSQARTRY